MGFGRLHPRALFAPALCGAMLSSSDLHAVAFSEFLDPNPAAGNQFGHTVVALSTGNVVITSPLDDFGGTNVGAVYLFNGATGALISTLRGSSAQDSLGSSGVVALADGNYLIVSPSWSNGAVANAGAVTWGSGTTGVSGTVSALNSLVGSTANDRVGVDGVKLLANGNYVVLSTLWDNGAMSNAGAVTWGSSSTGVSGAVSAANSLVGSSASDFAGSGGVTTLSNGHYVVASPNWDNAGLANLGAVTWGSGTTGVSGVASSSNSLVGSTSGDLVGSPGVTALTNGNYVVRSSSWDNGAVNAAGAVSWGSGTTGVSGAVSAANSLVGSTVGDNVGSGGVTALSNGNYVAVSPLWNSGAVADAGAVSWGSGTSGVVGGVSAANSLVGSTASDRVGFGGVTALANGNYVVKSQFWANGPSVGAATWGSGTNGVSGTVSAANSLVGSTSADAVGSNVTALTNGNYVVVSPSWDNVGAPNAGAATWGNGTSGANGTVSAANSLVGSTFNDNVGSDGVTALTNGNFVVVSTNWDNVGAVNDAGAVTWGNGTTGTNGTVSAANSLVGSTLGDQVGFGGVTALTNGNYVVASRWWDRGGVQDAGAVTWANGTTGVSGPITFVNSLVGSSAGDAVGIEGVTALTNGNYVVRSPVWNKDVNVLTTVGAVTWGSGATGVSGSVSEVNSLVGSTGGDLLGNTGLTALTNGGYVVASFGWSNGVNSSAGAASWGSGFAPLIGEVTAANSLIGGGTSPTGLQAVAVEDTVNGTFLARFLAEGGGRVRVRWADPSPAIVSATDVPDDQGGWLHLTVARSNLDDVNASPQVATYGVWRRVPGTLATRAGEQRTSGALEPRPDAQAVERLRPLLPPGVESWEVEGRLYVTASGTHSSENATGFPPGTWALLVSVPAAQQAQYVVALPTLTNAPYDYVVTAHTTVPSNWYISGILSGQSLDNLTPAQPTQFTAAYAGGQTNLQWAPNLEQDLASYRLYRGTSADFTPSPGNRIASPTSISYADVGPAGRYYKLSAEDLNGNESTFALITPQQTTDVGEGEAVVFALEGVRPNPARGNGLHVRFALPSGAPARLELHDVGGRRVLTRDVGPLGPGRHTVNLAEGRRVAAGIYWLSLSQGSQQQRTRVAVIH